MKVYAMYFSGTGTTKKVVESIAKVIADKTGSDFAVYDFSLPERRNQIKAFDETDVVVFGTPVYAGRVPNLLLKYIGTVVGNGAAAVAVSLYGNRNFDDGLIELRNLLTEDGFKVIAGGAFIGEHSFSKILGAGRPDTDDMNLACNFAGSIAAKISAGDFSEAKVKGENPIRPYYTPRDRHGNPINILKVKPKTNKDKCINCKHCAEICTMGSIDYEDVSNVSGICVKCCACEKFCPVGAKYFDDAGYIYHREELEAMYADRRREPEVFI